VLATDPLKRILDKWRITTDAFSTVCDVILVTTRSKYYRLEGEPSWVASDYDGGERFRSSSIAKYTLQDGSILESNAPPFHHTTVVAIQTISGSVYHVGATQAKPTL
jgi:hypothetical protein